MKKVLFALALCFLTGRYANAQILDGYDREPAVRFSDVTLFTDSDFYKANIPSIQARVHNMRGELLHNLSIALRVRRNRGPALEFILRPAGSQRDRFDLGKAQSITLVHEFTKPWPYSQGEVVDFEMILRSGEIPTMKDGIRFSGPLFKGEAPLKQYIESASLAGTMREQKRNELLSTNALTEVTDELEAVTMGTNSITVNGKAFDTTVVYLHDDSYTLNPDARAQSKYAEAVGWVLSQDLKTGRVVKWIDLKTGRLLK